MKAAVIVLSDPKSGSEESLGRLFNALAATYEFKQRGDDVRLLFQGAGTRWAGEVVKEGHPAHGLYRAVEDRVEGVSSACADVFGAGDAAEKAGLARVDDNPVPGTTGMPSLRRLLADGYHVLTF
jgi:DsrE/DsrF-like family